jgi:hypothetical protein
MQLAFSDLFEIVVGHCSCDRYSDCFPIHKEALVAYCSGHWQLSKYPSSEMAALACRVQFARLNNASWQTVQETLNGRLNATIANAADGAANGVTPVYPLLRSDISAKGAAITLLLGIAICTALCRARH